MTLKSVLQVDVSAAQWDRFAASYDQFERKLRNLPGALAQVNKKIDGTRSGFDKLLASAVADNVQAKLRFQVQEKADRLTRTTAERWRSMAMSSRELSANIATATNRMLSWAGPMRTVASVLGGFGGTALLAAGGALAGGALGFWGMDRLGLSVSAARRSALGLGLSYGEQQAFGINFGRFVDPASVLSNVAAAKMDVTKRVGLIGAGLSAQEMSGDTAQTSLALLRHLFKIADTTNPQFFGQQITARRLDQFGLTVEDLMRMRNTPLAERQRLFASYAENARTLNVPDDVAQKWQDFTTKMTAAGQGIENTFVRGLAPITPALGDLASGAEKVVRAFLGAPYLKEWLTKADEGLERFAKYIATPEFEAGIEHAATGIERFGEVVWKFLKLFGVSMSGGPSPAAASAPTPSDRAWDAQFPTYLPPGSPGGGPNGKVVWGGGATSADQAAHEAYIRAQAAALGIDPNVAVARARAEGLGRGPGDQGSSFGDYQLHVGGRSSAFPHSGLGDQYRRETGRDPSDPNNWQDMDSWYLRYAARKGWWDLTSARGRPQYEGIGVPGARGAARTQYADKPQIGNGYVPIIVDVHNNTGGNVATTVNGLKN